MPASSLRLVVECQRKGLLSKEAAAKVLERRDALIKSAMRRAAEALVASICDADEIKEAGPADFLRKGIGGAEEGGGFLSKLRKGGLTSSPGGHGWSDVAGNLGKMMALAGLTAGATTGVGAIMRHSRDKKLSKQIQQSYTQMFDEEPKLKELREDPERRGVIERNFGIMAQFAPSLAAVPAVAGSWVRAMAGQNQVSVGEIKNLAETQRRIDEMHEGRHGGPALSPLNAGNIAQTVLSGRGTARSD
jgi:hypothetical protein